MNIMNNWSEKKMGSFVYLCNLSIFAIYAYLRKKPKLGKPIYIYPPESSHYTLSENDMVYRDLNHRS